MKKIKYILFLLFTFFINIGLVCAKDDVINRIDVSITLDNSGNAHIEEVWDVFANIGTEFYKAEYNLGNMEISNFKVYENGILFTFIDDWDVDESLSYKAYKNGINYTSSGIELCWGKGSMGHHTFKIMYDVSNFVFKTEESIAIPSSVYTKGSPLFMVLPSNFDIPDWNIKVSYSFLVNLKQKSSGNLSIFLFLALLRLPEVTPYNVAKSCASITCFPLTSYIKSSILILSCTIISFIFYLT